MRGDGSSRADAGVQDVLWTDAGWSRDEVVCRGERDSGEFIAFWIHAGRMVGGMNVNVWDVNEHVRTLIQSQRVIDPAVLRDPDTPLESLVELVTTTHP